MADITVHPQTTEPYLSSILRCFSSLLIYQLSQIPCLPNKTPLPPGIFPERSLGSVISFQFSLTTPFFPSHMATFPLYSPVGKLSFSLYWILTMCVASDFLY